MQDVPTREIPPQTSGTGAFRLAVLMACHNRRETTLRCLEALFAQEGLPPGFQSEVFLVDDGSTDGTSDAVRERFPHVFVIQGDGNLYWNRGMIRAWDEAAKQGYDHYLWLNDDTTLLPGALVTLLDGSQRQNDWCIICGAARSRKTGALTYSGYIMKKRNQDIRALVPNGDFQPCDFFNGNTVLVPRSVHEALGGLDPFFHHGIGDFDFGLRARKCGIPSLVTPEAVAYCEKSSALPRWRDPMISFRERWRHFRAPAGPDAWRCCVFEARHRGWMLAIYHLISIHWNLFLCPPRQETL